MDVAYINPFIAGIREVFDSMVKMPFSIGRPRLRQCDERLHKFYSISAVIGLSGSVSGVFVLNLAEGVAIALAGALAGIEPLSLDADCLDALAEIANMIAGAAKKRLPAGQINISVPTLLRTNDVVYPTAMPILALPVDAPKGRFMIEVAMVERAQARK